MRTQSALRCYATSLRSATRITALRARGLMRSSASPARTALPIKRNLPCGTSLARIGTLRGNLSPSANITHEMLHYPVFQRMEADHHQASAGFDMRHTFWEHPRKLLEFLIEINPYSLKGPCRRILPSLTGTYRFTNQLDELPRGVDGFDVRVPQQPPLQSA